MGHETSETDKGVLRVLHKLNHPIMPDLFSPEVLTDIEQRLPEFIKQRLQAIDEEGVYICIPSQISPVVQQMSNREGAIEAA